MSGSGHPANFADIPGSAAFHTRNTPRSFSGRTIAFCAGGLGRRDRTPSGIRSGTGIIRSGDRYSAAFDVPPRRETLLNDKPTRTVPYTVRRSRQQMLRDVREGLARNPKRLSPKYFYDERGSELFEQITDLPEYYLTRAERALLGRTIPEIVGSVAPKALVELGAGSASKTRG